MVALLAAFAALGPIKLAPGLEISHSAPVRRGTYLLPSPHGSTGDTPGPAVIHIKGNNLVIDFRGAVLEGSTPETLPDQRPGTGIDVTGKNITIKNAVIRGYKVGLFAHKAPGLRLLHCDFSYNWKQHLRSTLEREDLSDWQSYHHNENREWMRYGAGAYLEDVDGFEVKGCRATGGQCGLLLVRSNFGVIWNNDFSFLSGLGLGMYRSSQNTVMHNKLDWCIRGFSYGVYNRGQDSAGILVFEQCSHNLFAYNSVTHGGDGFFLWAGQQTMDSGKGGCNENLLYANDFSHSPANAIEATFSRNQFIHNLCLESDYGVWGGYSSDSITRDNVIGACRIGVAFEHSQSCLFLHNTFEHCKSGVQLWATGKPDPSFGYAKGHETAAIDNAVLNNQFLDVPGSLVYLRGTQRTRIAGNYVVGPNKGIDADASNASVEARSVVAGTKTVVPVDWKTAKEYPADLRPMVAQWNPFPAKPEVKLLPGGVNPFLGTGALRGRRYMLVDEWGPYDFRSPRLWPRGEDGHGNQVLEVLGPKGSWKLVAAKGARLIGSTSGSVPGKLTLALEHGKAQNVAVTLEYVGGATVDYLGKPSPAGKAVRFAYRNFFAPIDWTSEFFQWDADTDPRTHDDAFRVLLAGPPIATIKSKKLDFSGYGAWAKGVPDNQFAISATGDFSVEPGSYILNLTVDDGARVFLDGKAVQLFDADGKPASAFHYQGPTAYTGPLTLAAGKHRLYLEYFQIDGYKTLQVVLKPKS